MPTPFVPSLFMFFFHLVNNWPKFALFMFDNSLRSDVERVEIRWSRPRAQTSFPFTGSFANSPQAFALHHGRVILSVCDSLPQRLRNLSLSFRWNFDGNSQHHHLLTQNCTAIWTAPLQGEYAVTVYGQSESSNTIRGSAVVRVVDRWVVAIGDSFASGEGNPDVPVTPSRDSPALWISEECHRSGRSWAFKVYERIRDAAPEAALHFTYLPCTGASVDNGILSSSTGTSQLDIVRQIANIRFRKSGPDVVLMSVGGNDIGYSEILSTLSRGESSSLFATVDMRFFYASYQLDRVGSMLNDINPKQVVIPHYFDVTRNEKGVVDAGCAALHQITTENLRQAEVRILRRINRLISNKAKQFGWTAVERVVDIFHSRGLCSSQPLIRDIEESMHEQGNIMGAFHPTEQAHRLIADLVWQHLVI